jgi:hypothetical protein
VPNTSKSQNQLAPGSSHAQHRVVSAATGAESVGYRNFSTNVSRGGNPEVALAEEKDDILDLVNKV